MGAWRNPWFVLVALADPDEVLVVVVLRLGGRYVRIAGRADFLKHQITLVVEHLRQVVGLATLNGFAVAHERAVAVGVVGVFGTLELCIGQTRTGR